MLVTEICWLSADAADHAVIAGAFTRACADTDYVAEAAVSILTDQARIEPKPYLVINFATVEDEWSACGQIHDRAYAYLEAAKIDWSTSVAKIVTTDDPRNRRDGTEIVFQTQR